MLDIINQICVKYPVGCLPPIHDVNKHYGVKGVDIDLSDLDTRIFTHVTETC